ncbi:MAG TPA: asparagine synthase (glutamine-hydrolyzing) [Anaerolineae bacterium]|nr:asparagine synthase (glutamine-hydrolyzing) [Anaerolineae bacterium]
MCGICGILHLDRAKLVEERSLQAMSEVLKHRGPDDEGLYLDGNLGFAHRRLSIIDLSPAAHQPMCIQDGRYWIVYNGEIYNYIELRQQLVAEGHTFRSNSDTEVILCLYQEKGADSVRYLNGMFAFVIWDAKKRELFAARDHFGIKPFYYSFNDGTFTFASEIKALFKSGEIKPVVSPEGIADYLTFQFCLGDKTLFQNVKKLLPGHYLVLSAEGVLSLRKYWNLDFSVDMNHTVDYFEHQLLWLLEDSVRLQLRADVPVGAHLSGGLDSSTVTCLASTLLGEPIHTFSGGFSEGQQYDETSYAAIVAEKVQSHHHEVFPTAREFVDAMPKLIYAMDEPAAGPGIFPQLSVSKLAKEHVKVVLGGQGGDEVFAGYIRYLIAYLEECIRGGIEGTQEDQKYVVSFKTILPNLIQLQGYQPLLRNFWSEGLFTQQDARYFRLVDRGTQLRCIVNPELVQAKSYKPYDAYCQIFNDGNLGSYINKMTRFDIQNLLPALLQVEDRTSMMVSLESRVPLLDHRIVELAASMPPKIKYEGGRSKHIFRKVVAHLLPTEIISREDKMGFPVPLSLWYKQEPVRSFVQDTLLGTRARERGWYDLRGVKQLLETERTFGRNVWGLLCLELWAQAFLDG